MIVAIGSDLVELERIRRVYRRHPERFLERHFTPAEQAYALAAADPAPRLAARWAAKEAFAKVWPERLGWREVWVAHEGPRPVLRFAPELQEKLERRGWRAHLTLSHERCCALAVVILEAITHPSPSGR
ncbi:4'-phosphopantetheinyl transferase superfamily protein [Oceanithermus sp.]